MDNTLELWIYLLTNVGAIVAGSLLTGLCFLAYRRNGDQSSYRFATIGFGLILLGTLVDPVYFFRMSFDYRLTNAELLLLQISEDVLFAAGLGTLFYAIVHHDASTSSTADNFTSYDEERAWKQNPWNDR